MTGKADKNVGARATVQTVYGVVAPDYVIARPTNCVLYDDAVGDREPAMDPRLV